VKAIEGAAPFGALGVAGSPRQASGERNPKRRALAAVDVRERREGVSVPGHLLG
jgi:hypothetical protein